jgi:hypothetical protein
MIKRNENEERVYKLLLDCGVPEDQIDEPDKQAGQQDKNPDFLVKQVDVVVEVKHFEDDELKKEDLAQFEKFKKGEVASWSAPLKNKQFERHLSDTVKKFRNYPDHSSLLIIDCSDIHFLVPDIEFMIGGLLNIHFDKKTGDVIRYSNTERKFRIDQYTEIGAVCFLEKSRISIFHNLMSDKPRRLPYYFWASQLEKVQFEQFAFFCPPGGISQIYKLELTK